MRTDALVLLSGVSVDAMIKVLSYRLTGRAGSLGRRGGDRPPVKTNPTASSTPADIHVPTYTVHVYSTYSEL